MTVEEKLEILRNAGVTFRIEVYDSITIDTYFGFNNGKWELFEACKNMRHAVDWLYFRAIQKSTNEALGIQGVKENDGEEL